MILDRNRYLISLNLLNVSYIILCGHERSIQLIHNICVNLMTLKDAMSFKKIFSISAPADIAPFKNASAIRLAVLFTPAGLPLNTITYPPKFSS